MYIYTPAASILPRSSRAIPFKGIAHYYFSPRVCAPGPRDYRIHAARGKVKNCHRHNAAHFSVNRLLSLSRQTEYLFCGLKGTPAAAACIYNIHTPCSRADRGTNVCLERIYFRLKCYCCLFCRRSQKGWLLFWEHFCLGTIYMWCRWISREFLIIYSRDCTV